MKTDSFFFSDLSASFCKLWKVIRDLVPRRAVGDPRMKLRPNSGIVIERAHPNRYLRPFRPITTEQTRAAIRAENFYRAFTSSVNFDQLLALEETELFTQNPGLRANRRSRVLPASFAMTMACQKEWRLDLKPHATAKATAVNGLVHLKLSTLNSQPSTISRCRRSSAP